MADLISNYRDRLLGFLPWEFQQLDNYSAVAGLIGDLHQEAENVAYDCIVKRTLGIAEGAQLDQYGALLDEPRNGLADAAYRRILYAKIASNASEGAQEELLTILELVTQGSLLDLYETFPAMVGFSYAVPAPLSTFHRRRLTRLMDRAIAGGVGLVYIAEAPLDYFGFFADPDAQAFNVGTMAEIVSDD